LRASSLTPSVARGTARTLANEMRSSFRALRSGWPVNLHSSYEPVTPSLAVAEELNRFEAIWAHALRVTGTDTSWLCGNHSIANAIFAPMAVRLANYGFDTRPKTQAYVAAPLADPALRRWGAMGLAAGQTSDVFEYDGPTRPWPGPAPPHSRPQRSTRARQRTQHALIPTALAFDSLGIPPEFFAVIHWDRKTEVSMAVAITRTDLSARA
jgi:hypothetical protein